MEFGGGWVIEVDIRDYFGSIDHEHLRTALGKRIADGNGKNRTTTRPYIKDERR